MTEARADAGDCVTLPLVTRTGEPGRRSGLNWGQRPEYGRDPDEGYIPIPASVYQRGFFPPRGIRFTVVADDGLTFAAVTAQEHGKAIHSADGNEILGRYFRTRLNVAPGHPITGSDLRAYGRTDVTFCKLGGNRFSMDFSV